MTIAELESKVKPASTPRPFHYLVLMDCTDVSNIQERINIAGHLEEQALSFLPKGTQLTYYGFNHKFELLRSPYAVKNSKSLQDEIQAFTQNIPPQLLSTEEHQQGMALLKEATDDGHTILSNHPIDGIILCSIIDNLLPQTITVIKSLHPRSIAISPQSTSTRSSAMPIVRYPGLRYIKELEMTMKQLVVPHTPPTPTLVFNHDSVLPTIELIPSNDPQATADPTI